MRKNAGDASFGFQVVLVLLSCRVILHLLINSSVQDVPPETDRKNWKQKCVCNAAFFLLSFFI